MHALLCRVTMSWMVLLDVISTKYKKLVVCLALTLLSVWKLQRTNSLLVQQGWRTGYDQMVTWNFAALAENRTRVNCLGSSYAIHYSTNACKRLCECLNATFPPAWEMYKFCPLKIVNIKFSICSNCPLFDSKHSSLQIDNVHGHWCSSAHCWASKEIAKRTVACKDTLLRWPGIEPGSTAWKAAMLTTIPPTHV